MRLSLDQVALGRYAISLLKEDERSVMGLWLSSGPETINNAGRIVKAGPPYRSAEDDDDDAPYGPQYSVGQIVVFGKYNGTEITVGPRGGQQDKFIIIAESDVLCTLRDLDAPKEEYDDIGT